MDYRGEVVGKFRTTINAVPSVYQVGERFAQLVIVPVPTYTIEEAETLGSTDRGEGGFGSTNNIQTSAPTQSQSLPDDKDESTNFEVIQEVAAEPTIGSEAA